MTLSSICAVAIYGKSFCTAAKDTWKLIKDRGVEAIINDNLIGNVLTMGSILIGVLCGAFGYAFIRIAKVTENTTYIIILVLVAFFLGLMMAVSLNGRILMSYTNHYSLRSTH
jgi:hypothetical protein